MHVMTYSWSLFPLHFVFMDTTTSTAQAGLKNVCDISTFLKFPAFWVGKAHKNRWMDSSFVQIFPFLWKCYNTSSWRAVNFILICQWWWNRTISPLFNSALVKVEHHSSHLCGTAPLKHSLWQVSGRGAVWKMRAITEKKHITLHQ